MSVDTRPGVLTEAGVPELFSAGYRADSAPTHRWLREHDPLHFDPRSQMVILTRMSDCQPVLRSAHASAAGGQSGRQQRTGQRSSMLTADGSEHERLRRPAHALFAPGFWQRPELREIWQGAVDDVGSSDSFDLSTQLAEPVASRVLALICGVPVDDCGELAQHAAAVRIALDPVPAPAKAFQAQVVLAQLTGYLRQLLKAAPDRAPGSLLTGGLGQGGLSLDEAVEVLALATVGGWGPLADLLTSSLAVALADRATGRQPQPTAVARTEEVLRWHSPIPFAARQLVLDLDLPSGRLLRGSRVLIMLGAANRDPACFVDPDELRYDRAATPDLSLGAGAHYCLGAALIRAVVPVVVSAFLQTYPVAELDTSGPLRWRAEIFPRRLLPVRVRPGDPARPTARG